MIIAFVLASCSKSSSDSNITPPTTTSEIGNTGVITTIPIVPPTNPNLPKGSTSTDAGGNTTTTVNTYNEDGTLNAEIVVKVASNGTKTKVIKKYTYDTNKNVTKVVTYDADLTNDSVKIPIEEITYSGYNNKGQHTEQMVIKYDEKGNVKSSVNDIFKFDNKGILVSSTKTTTIEGKKVTYDLIVNQNGNTYVAMFVQSPIESYFYQNNRYDNDGNLISISYDTGDKLYGKINKTYTYTTYPVDTKAHITTENLLGTGSHKVATETIIDADKSIVATYKYNDVGKLVSKIIQTKYKDEVVSEEIINYQY